MMICLNDRYSEYFLRKSVIFYTIISGIHLTQIADDEEVAPIRGRYDRDFDISST